MVEERSPLHLPHHKEDKEEKEEKQHGHGHNKNHGHVPGEKRPDQVIGLISAEQAKEAERREAEERKAEEEDGAASAKNKHVYQF
ncbi:hypothetical protein ZWY2020_023508 [Hordeum vulgare]|nr:hypothetical protein ZWY2020_023508 [Hordeum vulgare]